MATTKCNELQPLKNGQFRFIKVHAHLVVIDAKANLGSVLNYLVVAAPKPKSNNNDFAPVHDI